VIEIHGSGLRAPAFLLTNLVHYIMKLKQYRFS
jgi:hypothetical protein